MLIQLSAEQYLRLTRPTREDQYMGRQYEMAQLVKEQIMALTDKRVKLNEYDIIAINKAIEINGVGCFIATAAWRSGGWALNEWEQSTFSLRTAVNQLDWTDPEFSALGIMEY